MDDEQVTLLLVFSWFGFSFTFFILILIHRLSAQGQANVRFYADIGTPSRVIICVFGLIGLFGAAGLFGLFHAQPLNAISLFIGLGAGIWTAYRVNRKATSRPPVQ